MGGWEGGGAKEVVCIVVRSLAIWFAQLFLFGKGSVVPSRQPSCNLPNSSAIVARLQIAIVRTERQKQRLYLHRIIALVMT